MLNGIDILVTSIRNLERLINNSLALFKAKRLKRVIFDEIDSMYLRFGVKSVHKVYSSLCPVADKQVGCFCVTRKRPVAIFLLNFPHFPVHFDIKNLAQKLETFLRKGRSHALHWSVRRSGHLFEY